MGSSGVVCGVKEEHGEEYGKEDQAVQTTMRVYKRSFPIALSRRGIEKHFTLREISQEKRVTERMNTTLLEKIGCMLSNAGILKSF